jgi:hypothetical protein
MQEPTHRLVPNTDPQEHVVTAVVLGLTSTACLQLPVSIAMLGRTLAHVSTDMVRMNQTTCLKLHIAITPQPVATATVRMNPTKIMMLHDSQPEDPESDKEEKQEEGDSEFVLDDEGNKIFAYEMRMSKRVKINMELLKTLDLLKFVLQKAPSPIKKIKKGRKLRSNLLLLEK